MTKANILVVEDEIIIAIDIRNRVLSLGYGVSGIVSTGEEAIEKAAETLPDLVLMDIKLRGKLDGVEAASRIRQDLDIPVVYLTAYTNNSTLKRAKMTEPFGYLVKPFENPELQAALEIGLYKHRMERRLKESESRFRLLFENSPDAIFITNPDSGEILDANPAASELLLKSHAEIVGLHQSKLHPSYMLELVTTEFSEQIRASRQNRKPLPIESAVLRADGSEVPVEVLAQIVHLNGNPVFQSSFRDISQRKQAEEEKKRLEAQLHLAQKMEAIGTLAGGIAHDFNNLLMAIQGNASLLRHTIESAHPHYERLKTIEQLVGSGAKLTAQLLGYASKGRYEVKAIDLNRLAEGISDTFGRAKKDIIIHMELAEDLLPVEADQGQIEQVLLNLFVNAVDAMPDGGELILRTMNVTSEDMKDRLYEPKSGRYVLLNVADNGTGMDKETQKRIFDPFFTTKETGQGTGLGLASAYGIIKGHGGYIDVESTEGQGTTFRVYLPASVQMVDKTNEKPNQPITGSGTILIVDDEELVLDANINLLKSVGYTVYEAKGGREAVEIYNAHKDEIDLVILDMIMPQMGGAEAFDRMKAINPNVRVLLSSGFSLEAQAREILNRGCDGFIQKPFGLEELSRKISEILAKT
jgi:PAS domain S-box-containing protein